MDGVRGPLDRSAVSLPAPAPLAVDGIAGPQTRRALGRRGRPRLGSRVMRIGQRGWDVAALQFLLQRRGFGARRGRPCSGSDPGGGRARSGAGRDRRRRSRRPGDHPCAARGRQPEAAGQREGPGRSYARAGTDRRRLRGAARGRPRHQGLDFPAPFGTRSAPRPPGTTIFAGPNYGGYGDLVVIQHPLGYTTWYAHMARITS